jgi:hypothetical protein
MVAFASRSRQPAFFVDRFRLLKQQLGDQKCLQLNLDGVVTLEWSCDGADQSNHALA